MRRLIDKDALLKEIDQKYAENFPVEKYIMDCIRTAPVIDPVRHGYWIDHGRNRPPTCSECCGCPISYKAVQDLELIQPYEPNVVKAAWAIFGPSYRYRQKYNEYKEARMRAEKIMPGQMSLEVGVACGDFIRSLLAMEENSDEKNQIYWNKEG